MEKTSKKLLRVVLAVLISGIVWVPVTFLGSFILFHWFEYHEDNDWDGVSSAQGDCDDHNPYVYPGIEENIENDRDDNCDGRVDELCDLLSVAEFLYYFAPLYGDQVVGLEMDQMLVVCMDDNGIYSISLVEIEVYEVPSGGCEVPDTDELDVPEGFPEGWIPLPEDYEPEQDSVPYPINEPVTNYNPVYIEV